MKFSKFFKPSMMASAAIILLAVVLTLCGRGMNLGLDFTGGLSMPYSLGQSTAQPDVAALLGADYSVTIQGADKSEVLVRIKSVGEADVQDVQAAVTAKLQSAYPNAQPAGDDSYVGPVAGKVLVKNAVLSVLLASVLMLVYIAFRFDFSSGLAAVIGLLHDVLIMLSFMVLLRSFIQMNSSFIAAMLMIVGYSINNTIVIFDRIRENNRKPDYAGMEREEIVNISVRESLGRTINTTLTTLVTIVALYVLGVDAIREFSLPIIVGILSGVYSANMINGYVWALLEEIRLNRKPAKKA